VVGNGILRPTTIFAFSLSSVSRLGADTMFTIWFCLSACSATPNAGIDRVVVVPVVGSRNGTSKLLPNTPNEKPLSESCVRPNEFTPNCPATRPEVSPPAVNGVW
jgi:hypothetical protein